MNPSVSPYATFAGNPIWRNDVLGNSPTEYDKDGNKLSSLGGDKIDFRHQDDGSTKVIDKQTGASNVIKNGESLIRGYTLRDGNAGWGKITNEYLMQQGPDNSLYADFENSDWGPFKSLHSIFSSYSTPARRASLGSTDKGQIKMDYGDANPMVARDMWEQMWGRSNVSFYKLGDKTLFLMTDAKSATSLFYRMTPSWERSPNTMLGNTRQTYLWVENNATVQRRVEGASHFTAPKWAQNSVIGAHIYFIFTGKDSGLPDKK